MVLDLVVVVDTVWATDVDDARLTVCFVAACRDDDDCFVKVLAWLGLIVLSSPLVIDNGSLAETGVSTCCKAVSCLARSDGS